MLAMQAHIPAHPHGSTSAALPQTQDMRRANSLDVELGVSDEEIVAALQQADEYASLQAVTRTLQHIDASVAASTHRQVLVAHQLHHR